MGFFHFFSFVGGGYLVPGKSSSPLTKVQKGFSPPVSDVPFWQIFVVFRGMCIFFLELVCIKQQYETDTIFD